MLQKIICTLVALSVTTFAAADDVTVDNMASFLAVVAEVSAKSAGNAPLAAKNGLQRHLGLGFAHSGGSQNRLNVIRGPGNTDDTSIFCDNTGSSTPCTNIFIPATINPFSNAGCNGNGHLGNSVGNHNNNGNGHGNGNGNGHHSFGNGNGYGHFGCGHLSPS